MQIEPEHVEVEDKEESVTGSSRLLAGQKALVTGASSGIGRAMAVALGVQGAAVVVNHRSDRDAAEAVVAAIEQGGGEAFAFQADVSREDEVEAMLAEAVNRHCQIKPIW